MKTVHLLCGAALIAVPAQGQTVRGTIVEDSSRMPINGATVELVAATSGRAGSTLSDSTGGFVLHATTPGRYTLQLTHPSYAITLSDTISLAAGEVIEIQLQMGRQAIPIAPVVVTTRSNARAGGFYDRMQSRAFGYFITRHDIEKRASAGRTTDLLRGVPGVELLPARRSRGGSSANVIAMRGDRRCPPAIFIDGAPVRQMNESGIDDLLTPDGLEAVEIYRSSAGTPAQFLIPNTCGAIAFWTRLGGEDGTKFSWKRLALGAASAGVLVLIASFLTRD